MPAKPAWYRNLSSILEKLRAYPHPYVDRTTIQFLLQVGPRRAQQILQPCIVNRIGKNGLADRNALIDRLQKLANGEDARYEIRRRQKVAGLVEQLRKERLERPQLLIEAPVATVNRRFADLPDGVLLEPGRIVVEFQEPQQALEKLLALAMAISNDFDSFELRTKTE